MKKFENNISDIFAAPKYAACYANLASNRIIFLSEIIDNSIASTLSALLLNYANEGTDDISIYINTNGGHSGALTHILDIMEIIKRDCDIKTICIGKAYSAGAFILAAGTKGKRLITKNSCVMIHGVQCEFPGPYNDQGGSQIYYNFLKSSNKVMLEGLSKHTGKTYEQVVEDCKKDTFLSAEESVQYGICDSII